MKIIKYQDGWIYATMDVENEIYNLKCSTLFGYNIIKELLKLIYEYVKGRSDFKYIIWNEENDYYIFKYSLCEDVLLAIVYYYNKVCNNDVIEYGNFILKEERRVFEKSEVFWTWAENIFNSIKILVLEDEVEHELVDYEVRKLLKELSYYFKN